MAVGPSIHDLHFADAPSVDTVPGPNSRRLLKKQQDIESNAVYYPQQVPIALEEGRGATVRDVDGNVFLDFYAGIGVLNVGHSNPYVTSAVTEQITSLVHSIDFPTEARLELIEMLDEIAPGELSGQNRVLFGGPTGSDAVEGSIKLAKSNTGGHSLISFHGGYHGGSAGALSLSSTRKFKEEYTPLLPDVHYAPYPTNTHTDLSESELVTRSLNAVRTMLEDPSSGVTNPAGVWVEPIQGEGGVIVPPEGFLSGLKEIVEEHHIPLIVDEIQTGLGRTGQWFASDWYDLTPDAMPMAKALGGIGLPLSATMYHSDIDTWDPGSHAGTFRGHVPAMVAGARAIKYMQSHNLLEHVQTVGQQIQSRLRDFSDGSEHVSAVRGKGLFIGVEFVTAAGNPSKSLATDIQKRCLEQGVIVWTAGRHGEVLRLVPPLVITEEQAATGTGIIIDAARAAIEQG